MPSDKELRVWNQAAAEELREEDLYMGIYAPRYRQDLEEIEKKWREAKRARACLQGHHAAAA